MSADLEAAFRYPLRGEGALRRFLVGAGVPSLLAVVWVFVTVVSLLLPFFGLANLLLYPVWFVVSLAWLGYFVAVVRATFAGETEPPSFADWERLLRDGAAGFAVGLVYAVPGFVVAGAGLVGFVALVGVSLGADASSSLAGFGVLALLFGFVLLLAYVAYAVLATYLFPVSLCLYADEGSVRSAFDRRRLAAVATDGDYAFPWLVVAGAYVMIQTVVGGLTAVLVGYLLYPFLPFVVFYLWTAGSFAFARAYAGVVEEVPEPAG